jgi:ornithine decarboxylase
MLKTLVKLGVGFDCASLEEIKIILELEVSPDNIIFANPCKQADYIKYANDNGVDMMTFDNEEELIKIKNIYPLAKLVMRIHVDDSHSLCQFGVKFGVRGNTRQLFECAKKLNLQIIGISFHVGSGCRDANAYYDAIKRAKEVFDEGIKIGFEMTLLDIGGGFPGFSGNGVEFEKIARVIKHSIDEFFPDDNIKIIAEPGRFFAASAFTLATAVTSRRTIVDGENKRFMYYVNDGVYGSFNCMFYDHAVLPPLTYIKKDEKGRSTFTYPIELEKTQYMSSIWGPTCDSLDCLTRSLNMPELNIGDWIVYKNMGAYTLPAASRFNGIEKAKIYYVNSIDLDKAECNVIRDPLMNDSRNFII